MRLWLQVEAEEVTELSVRYEVAVVPLCLFLKVGALEDQIFVTFYEQVLTT